MRSVEYGWGDFINDLPKEIIDYGLTIPEVHSNTTFELIAVTGNLDRILTAFLGNPSLCLAYSSPSM